MIKRDSLFSDITINKKFRAHRVVLAEASETFKNMISVADEDVRELNLPYPDGLVDELLDYIYYKKCSITINLYELIAYMHIREFTINQEIINIMPVNEFREILTKFDIEYQPNIEEPSIADYRFLCCLPHKKFMKLLKQLVCKTYLRDAIENENENETQLFYIAVTLRCLIPWYENHHITYISYHYAIGYGYEIDGICKTLIRNPKMTKYDLLSVEYPDEDNVNITNQCVEVLKSLGVNVPE
jgi:hypothetical protein